MYGNLLPKSFCYKRIVDNVKLQSAENEKGKVPQHGKIRPMHPLGLACCSSTYWGFGLLLNTLFVS